MYYEEEVEKQHPFSAWWAEYGMSLCIGAIFVFILSICTWGMVDSVKHDHLREATASKLCLSQYGYEYHLQDSYRYDDGTYGGHCVEVQMVGGVQEVVDEKTVQFRL